MERDPTRSGFDVTDHADYQRVQPKPSAFRSADQAHDIHSLHGNRKSSALSNSAALEVTSDWQKNIANQNANVCSMEGAVFQPYRASRVLSFVAAPKAHMMHSTLDSSRHPTERVQEGNPYVMVIYTNFSIVPAFEPPPLKATFRALHPVGFTPMFQSPSPIGSIGAISTGMGAVMSAKGGTDLQFSARQVTGSIRSEPSLNHDYLVASQASTASLCSKPADHLTIPTSSTVQAVVPGSYAMTPPIYQDSLNPTYLRSSEVRQGMLLQNCPRQELPLQSQLQSQAVGELRGAVRVVMEQKNQHQQLQQQLYLQQTHQMQQFQGARRAHGFETDKHGKMQLSERMNFSQRQPPRQQLTAVANVQGIFLHQPDRHEKNARITATPPEGSEKILARRHDREVLEARHMPDSMPATPVTAATTSTVPFSTAPSSPENNGSSSNGSAQREHACQHPGCTKTFDRRYNLTVHFRRHTDEMPYPCKVEGCPQRFKWRSSQSHHMKTRHQMSSTGKGGALRVGKVLVKKTFTNKSRNKSQSSETTPKLRYVGPPEAGDGLLRPLSQQESGSGGGMADLNGSQKAKGNGNFSSNDSKNAG